MKEMVRIMMNYPSGTILTLQEGDSSVENTVVGYKFDTTGNYLELNNGTAVNIKRLEGPGNLLIKKVLPDPPLTAEQIEYFTELDD